MKKPSAKRARRITASPTPIRTLKELGELVGRDTGTVGKWTKRGDWPFPRSAPWSRSEVPKILRWVADTLVASGGGPADTASTGDEVKDLRKQKLQQEIRKLHAQADTAETALARERWQLLDANEVKQEWASLGALIRTAFQNFASQIVPLALSHGMPHEAAGNYSSQIDEAVRANLRHLSEGGNTAPAGDDDEHDD